jgi:hypothetical protein
MGKTIEAGKRMRKKIRARSCSVALDRSRYRREARKDLAGGGMHKGTTYQEGTFEEVSMRWLAWVSTIPATIISLSVGYHFGKLEWSRYRAERLCEAARPGRSTGEMERYAKRLRLNVWVAPDDLTAWDGHYETWGCSIQFEAGKVISHRLLPAEPFFAR